MDAAEGGPTSSDQTAVTGVEDQRQTKVTMAPAAIE